MILLSFSWNVTTAKTLGIKLYCFGNFRGKNPYSHVKRKTWIRKTKSFRSTWEEQHSLFLWCLLTLENFKTAVYESWKVKFKVQIFNSFNREKLKILTKFKKFHKLGSLLTLKIWVCQWLRTIISKVISVFKSMGSRL